jgi:hypothetical protein
MIIFLPYMSAVKIRDRKGEQGYCDGNPSLQIKCRFVFAENLKDKKQDAGQKEEHDGMKKDYDGIHKRKGTNEENCSDQEDEEGYSERGEFLPLCEQLNPSEVAESPNQIAGSYKQERKEQ